ncbi:low affinity immunoglobulin epsilon Fc receptor-like [Mercenaria mercenaria]|uniref:low affinity immunoglobulin epsilon Fc receptor-like n=1 Tax=Mercenaria mercenaria TaxID=6596 RepID=UPI00234F7F28|nr:low affinity immunoglobulin epsilon Fc receptor-like [Mercenaria mercenaria]
MMGMPKWLYVCFTLMTYVHIREYVVTMQNVKYIAVSEMLSSVATMSVPSKLSCGVVCEENDECVSFSYNNATEICQLSDKDPMMAPVEVVASNGSTLYHLKGCEEGWDVYKRKCYLFSYTSLTWESSKSYCESLGTSLVKVESDDEHQFIRHKLQIIGYSSGFSWIGARYNESAGEHRWIDGTEISFNGWPAGEPGTSKGCVDYLDFLEAGGWLWNSHWNCIGDVGPCICEKGINSVMVQRYTRLALRNALKEDGIVVCCSRSISAIDQTDDNESTRKL